MARTFGLGVLVLLCCPWVAASSAQTAPAATASAPVHGLRGAYYTPHLDRSFPDYKALAFDAFHIPTPLKEPEAVRIDPQIAFGRGKGFDRSKGQLQWFPHPQTAAAVWTGYIRFPTPGTYFLVTVSDDSSAVWLNDARICLNGGFGGAPPDPRFAYEDPGAGDTYNASENAYVVPVIIDQPGIHPVRVAYSMHNMSSGHGFGIDLYWVTPNSRKNARDLPIAELVPTEALYVEPPAAPLAADASGPHCTMTSDFAYVTLDRDKRATMTIRVRDRNGRPLAGKRVYLSTLSTYGSRDEVEQPAGATDENGVATGRILFRKGKPGHVASVFATVLGDAVDVSNVCEIVVEQTRGGLSFLPDTYSPYYDEEVFRIEPLPLRVGQPATFTTSLQNDQKAPALVFVRLSALPWNIGMKDWPTIGESQRMLLQPGESEQVTIHWTPVAESSHQCFKINVMGWMIDPKAAPTARRSARPNRRGSALLLAAATAPQPQPLPTPTGDPSTFDVRQRNIGPVERCQPPNPNDPTQFGLPPNNKLNSPYGNWRIYRKDGTAQSIDPSTYVFNPKTDVAPTADKANPRMHGGNDYQSRKPKQNYSSPLPFTSNVYGKVKLMNDKWNRIRVTTCDGYHVEFLHASNISVKDGEEVVPGAQLGITGEVGAKGAGVHLHVQVRDKNLKAVNPNTTGPLAKRPACDPKRECVEEDESPKEYARRMGPRARELADAAFDYAMANKGKLSGTQMEQLLRMYQRYDKLSKDCEILAADPPDPQYQRLAPAPDETPAGLVSAITRSWERFGGARLAEDRHWTQQHLAAVRAYEQKLADSHRAMERELTATATMAPQGAGDDEAAKHLRQQLHDRLRTKGLTSDDLATLNQAGISAGAAREAVARVLQHGAADDLDAIEFPDLAIFADTSQLLREMAALEASGAAAAHELSQARSSQRPARQPLGEFKQSFLVANPNAKREQVKLTIRRLALPPDWRVALVADPPPDDASTEHAHDAPAPANAKAPALMTENQGRAYSIDLDPGQQVHLTSILLPIGPAGEETRPRWAVEGSIGSTVIGGVVHEMHVPAAAETIQLPPAGAEEATAPSPDLSTAAGTRAVAAPAVDLSRGSRKWLWIVLVLLALLAITAAWWAKHRRPT